MRKVLCPGHHGTLPQIEVCILGRFKIGQPLQCKAANSSAIILFGPHFCQAKPLNVVLQIYYIERGRAAAAGRLRSVWKVPPPLDTQTSPKDVGRELRLWHRNETAPRPGDDAARLRSRGKRMKRRNPVGASQNRADHMAVQPSSGMALS